MYHGTHSVCQGCSLPGRKRLTIGFGKVPSGPFGVFLCAFAFEWFHETMIIVKLPTWMLKFSSRFPAKASTLASLTTSPMYAFELPHCDGLFGFLTRGLMKL